MKKILLLLMILFVQQLFAQQNKLINIIEKHGKAIGGIERWQQLKSSRVVTESQRENGLYTITSTMQRPNKFRIDFLNEKTISIKSYNGEQGWIVVNGELKEMNEGETKEMAEEGSFYEELALALNNRVQLQYLGEELLDGRKVHKIKMIKSNTDEQIYYVNTSTYLIDMISEYSEDADFKGTYFKTKLKNYKDFNGFLYPTYMELYANDKLFRTYKTRAVESNLKIDDNFFNPPNPWLNEKYKKKLNELDFWVGKWDVYKYATDSLIGRSNIEKITGGFGIGESFYAIPGPFHGSSLSKFNFFNGKWEQFWIDNNGITHYLSGTFGNDEGVVFTEEEKRGQTTIYHRLILKPQANGDVRQTWHQSQDNQNWEIAFDALYKRK